MRKGNIKILEMLLQYGASTEVRNHEDFTPLHLAITYNSDLFVRMLLMHDADVNARAKVLVYLPFPSASMTIDCK